jgi:small ligand-binding sensory domain FIST
MKPFAFAHARGPSVAQACAAQLGRPGRGLGFLYFTDALVGQAQHILDTLRGRTGVADWVGTVGTGVIATGTEYQDEPALAAMVADIDAYSIFSGRKPLKGAAPHFAVVHVDPSAPELPGLVADMASKTSTGFLAGGISSSRSRTLQIANEVLSGGISGAALGKSVAVATRLSQGCTPFPGRWRVTGCEDNVVFTLDGRPALDVLIETVKGEQAQLLVGLSVPGSDTGDYTARNLIGVDPKTRAIGIGDAVEPGAEIVFCKRDAAAARADLERILAELKAAAPAPRGALYFSCVARGEHMFGSRGAEPQLIAQALGEVPLVGFFCNGEISRDRLYGYTGVLTLFQ